MGKRKSKLNCPLLKCKIASKKCDRKKQINKSFPNSAPTKLPRNLKPNYKKLHAVGIRQSSQYVTYSQDGRLFFDLYAKSDYLSNAGVVQCSSRATHPKLHSDGQSNSGDIRYSGTRRKHQSPVRRIQREAGRNAALKLILLYSADKRRSVSKSHDELSSPKNIKTNTKKRKTTKSISAKLKRELGDQYQQFSRTHGKRLASLNATALINAETVSAPNRRKFPIALEFKRSLSIETLPCTVNQTEHAEYTDDKSDDAATDPMRSICDEDSHVSPVTSVRDPVRRKRSSKCKTLIKSRQRARPSVISTQSQSTMESYHAENVVSFGQNQFGFQRITQQFIRLNALPCVASELAHSPVYPMNIYPTNCPILPSAERLHSFLGFASPYTLPNGLPYVFPIPNSACYSDHSCLSVPTLGSQFPIGLYPFSSPPVQLIQQYFPMLNGFSKPLAISGLSLPNQVPGLKVNNHNSCHIRLDNPIVSTNFPSVSNPLYPVINNVVTVNPLPVSASAIPNSRTSHVSNHFPCGNPMNFPDTSVESMPLQNDIQNQCQQPPRAFLDSQAISSSVPPCATMKTISTDTSTGIFLCADSASNIPVVNTDPHTPVFSFNTSSTTSPYVNDGFKCNSGTSDRSFDEENWFWEGEPFQKQVFLKPDSPPVLRLCYRAIRHSKDGMLICEQDNVLLCSGPDRCNAPHVAKVTALYEDCRTKEKMMALLWYYRPEHLSGFRSHKYVPNELFASRHCDSNSVDCIEDKAYVLSASAYARFMARLKYRLSGHPRLPLNRIVPLKRSSDDGGSPQDVEQELGSTVSPANVFMCRSIYDCRSKRLCRNLGYLDTALCTRGVKNDSRPAVQLYSQPTGTSTTSIESHQECGSEDAQPTVPRVCVDNTALATSYDVTHANVGNCVQSKRRYLTPKVGSVVPAGDKTASLFVPDPVRNVSCWNGSHDSVVNLIEPLLNSSLLETSADLSVNWGEHGENIASTLNCKLSSSDPIFPSVTNDSTSGDLIQDYECCQANNCSSQNQIEPEAPHLFVL